MSMRKILRIVCLLLLMISATGCAVALQSAIMAGDVKAIDALLKEGADINQQDFAGMTPLMSASISGSVETVRLLLDRGADVNKGSGLHGTPLVLAAGKGRTELVRLLLDRGADMNRVKFGGDTPLMWAAYNGHVSTARILIERGADADQAIGKLQGSKGAVLIQKILDERSQPAVAVRTGAVVKDRDVSPPRSTVEGVPPAKATLKRNAYAIVVGIEEYRQKLPKADYAANDARLVTQYLTRTLGYPRENVITLINEHATHVDLVKYLEKWLHNQVEQDSTVFIYYSGHGAPDPKTGGAYLVPYDGDPSFIAETGYSLSRMYDALGKLSAKKVIVALDSCFSGAGGRSVIAKGMRPLVMNISDNLPLSGNMTVLTASAGEQTSSTYDEKGHGLFTYFLLKGIKDEDVVKPDGSIRIEELFRYIKPQVEYIARKQYNNEQTPQLIAPQGVK